MNDILVRSIAGYVPKHILPNARFVERLDTSDEWIVERTGIRERRRAAPDEKTSDMGYQAAKLCLEQAGVKASEIGLIVCTSVTGDTNFPPTVKWIQQHFKNCTCWSWDLKSGCTSFIDAVGAAYGALSVGMIKYALIIAAEKMTSIANYQDRGTCILFGDGAAAMLLEAIDPKDNPYEYGIKNFHFGSDPNQAKLLVQHAGGSNEPITHENIDSGRQYLYMEGNRVFGHAVKRMKFTAQELARKAGLKVSDFDRWVFHDANGRITERVGKDLKISDKIFSMIEWYGNTSCVTIPLCIDQMVNGKEKLLHPGHQLGLVSFGTGFAWAGVRIVWGHYD